MLHFQGLWPKRGLRRNMLDVAIHVKETREFRTMFASAGSHTRRRRDTSSNPLEHRDVYLGPEHDLDNQEGMHHCYQPYITVVGLGGYRRYEATARHQTCPMLTWIVDPVGHVASFEPNLPFEDCLSAMHAANEDFQSGTRIRIRYLYLKT